MRQNYFFTSYMHHVILVQISRVNLEEHSTKIQILWYSPPNLVTGTENSTLTQLLNPSFILKVCYQLSGLNSKLREKKTS